MTLTSLISEEQPPHGSAVDHTEWKQAREEGTQRGEQGAPAMIDVDDSSQSDVSSCQSSHGANTHTRTHTFPEWATATPTCSSPLGSPPSR